MVGQRPAKQLQNTLLTRLEITREANKNGKMKNNKVALIKYKIQNKCFIYSKIFNVTLSCLSRKVLSTERSIIYQQAQGEGWGNSTSMRLRQRREECKGEVLCSASSSSSAATSSMLTKRVRLDIRLGRIVK